jgi:hypothetical protein
VSRRGPRRHRVSAFAQGRHRGLGGRPLSLCISR